MSDVDDEGNSPNAFDLLQAYLDAKDRRIKELEHDVKVSDRIRRAQKQRIKELTSIEAHCDTLCRSVELYEGSRITKNQLAMFDAVEQMPAQSLRHIEADAVARFAEKNLHPRTLSSYTEREYAQAEANYNDAINYADKLRNKAGE